MPDGVFVAVKLKEQGEFHALGIVRLLHQNAVGVQDFLEDLRAEPFRDQRDFQIAAVAVVGIRTEIHDAVGVEGRTVALGVQGNADSARDRLGRRVGIARHAFHDRFGQLGGVDVFQIVFDLVAHWDTSSSKEYRTS